MLPAGPVSCLDGVTTEKFLPALALCDFLKRAVLTCRSFVLRFIMCDRPMRVFCLLRTLFCTALGLSPSSEPLQSMSFSRSSLYKACLLPIALPFPEVTKERSTSRRPSPFTSASSSGDRSPAEKHIKHKVLSKSPQTSSLIQAEREWIQSTTTTSTKTRHTSSS